MLTNAQRYLHILFTLAFILVGVSPACEFISGKNGFIEICTADGSIKRIAVSDEFNPAPEQQPQEHKTQKSDCGFCFANTHLSKNLLAVNHIKTIANTSKSIGITYVFAYKSASYSNFQPRAPPISFA